MPVRYDQDTKAKAIRLVREHAGDYPSEYAAITAVARRLGMTPETLRKWIRQAAVDEGQAPGVTTEASKEIRELKRKVSERAEPLPAAGLPHHRAIVALDIERSTSRPDPVKAELRRKLYELFDTALLAAGIRRRYRDRFTDRGDGILALIHPVDQAPKAALLKTAIPALSQLLTDYNAGLPRASQPQRQLRVRVVVHAGEVHYDAKGCFGEALDIAFRLLDAANVKKALQAAADPLILVISGDIYRAIVRHGYDGIDQRTFHPLVRVHIAGNRYPGWIHIPGQPDQDQVTEIASYRQPA